MFLYISSKKSSLVSGNRPSEKIFYHLPAHKSPICMRIYFLFLKKNTNKKNSTSKYICTSLYFFLLKQ